MVRKNVGSLGCLVGCYEWFPPLPVAASRGDTGQLVYATFLEKRDVFEHEPIKGVDLSVLHNLTEVYLGFVFWCELGMLHVEKVKCIVDWFTESYNAYRGESGCAQERRGVVYQTDKWAISGIPDLTRGEPG